MDQTALQVLNLEFNELSGAIPPTLGNVSDLSELKLNNNNLSEEFPEELGKLNKLKLLYVHFNGIHGRISSELDKMPVEQLKLRYGSNFPFNSNYKSLYSERERVVGEEIGFVKKCWEKMGGSLLLGPNDQLKAKHMKQLFNGGGDKDIRMWKGVEIDPNSGRVSKIGERRLESIFNQGLLLTPENCSNVYTRRVA